MTASWFAFVVALSGVLMLTVVYVATERKARRDRGFFMQ